jgi:ubiquinone/menaquinone biosynthesis C-methylase UbiE
VNTSNQEHSSTYYIQDRSNEEELQRLVAQDQMMTASMNGVLAEQTDPSRIHRVLDVACGTGGWLIQLAKEYPHIQCEGVDISGKMLEYAREQAILHQVQDRVQFHVMDALRMLEFPGKHFDLVNLRFGISFVRTWEWAKMLQEMRRVCKPEGIVRLSDVTSISSTSQTLDYIMLQIGLPAAIRAGFAFGEERDATPVNLARLMSEHRFRDIQQANYPVEYHAGTPQHHLFVEDIRRMLHLAPAFWRKWTSVPDDYETRYERMLREVEQPDFVATWPLFTIWGQA